MDTPSKFNILDDNCSSDDLTTDKTHQRLADQLCDLIQTGDSKGMTIGLEGDWGSGKSTVVELLRQKLQNDKKTFFFYIDTWQHEGDPLRRSFLETLIDSAEKAPATIRQTNRRLSEIGNKLAFHSAVTHHSMNWFGGLLAISALFIPIGAALVSTYAKGCLGHLKEDLWNGFTLGVLLCMAPLVPGLIYVLIKICQKIRKKDSSGLFSTTRQIDTTFSSERTSVEFSKYFDEIASILSSDYSRIVMVIDNLDRIDQADALRIWATLQTFVQQRNPTFHQDKGPAKWIVIPYAHEGLGRIWNSDPDTAPDSEVGENQPNAQKGAASRGHQVASFMDKSFNLRFHVPKMVIDDWRAFARNCLREAAPDLNGADAKTILDVLLLMRDKLSAAPSPRKIKLYINHVGLLWKLHYHLVSLNTICCYAALKYVQELSDSEIERRLLDQTLPFLPSGFGAADRFEGMAALLYGIPQNRAMQMLLLPQFEQDLQNSDVRQLQETRKSWETAFDAMTEYVTCKAWYGDLSSLGHILASLQKAFAGIADAPCELAFRVLKENVINLRSSIASQKHEDALALIELSGRGGKPDEALATAYAKSLPEKIHLIDGSNKRAKRQEEYRGTGSELVAKLEEVSEAAKTTIKIPYGSLLKVISVIQTYPANDMHLLAKHLLDVDAAEEEIATHIQSTKIPDWTAYFLEALTSNGMTKVGKVVTALKNALEKANGNLLQTDSAPNIWRILVAIDALPEAVRPTKEITEVLEAILPWLHSSMKDCKMYYLMAKYLEMQPNEIRNLQGRLSDYLLFWNSANPKAGAEIYQYVAHSRGYDWVAREAERGKKLMGNIIETAVREKDKNLFLVPDPFKFVSAALSLVGKKERKSLAELFASTANCEETIPVPTKDNARTWPEVCHLMLEHCPNQSLWDRLAEIITGKLQEVSQATWRPLLDSKELVPLLGSLEERNRNVDLGATFYSFFKELSEGELTNSQSSALQTTELGILYRSMAPSFRQSFAVAMGRILLNSATPAPRREMRAFLLEDVDFGTWVKDTEADIMAVVLALGRSDQIDKLAFWVDLFEKQPAHSNLYAVLEEKLGPPLEQLTKEGSDNVRRVSSLILAQIRSASDTAKQ